MLLNTFPLVFTMEWVLSTVFLSPWIQGGLVSAFLGRAILCAAEDSSLNSNETLGASPFITQSAWFSFWPHCFPCFHNPSQKVKRGGRLGVWSQLSFSEGGEVNFTWGSLGDPTR